MQIRVQLATGLGLALVLTTACGKSGGGSKSPDKPKKPTITTPGLPVTDGTPTEPTKPSTDPAKPGTDPTKPVTEPTKPVTEPTKPVTEPTKPVVTDKFPNAVKGLWGIAIAQKPRACSSFYDLRNSETMIVHLLCPGDSGRSISLQTETFTRTSDDGAKASFKRVASTCGISPTAPGTVFLSYKKDSSGRMQFIEGSRTSPLMEVIDPSNLAGDLGTTTSLHGRNVIRGCFKSGNLQNFEAARG